MAYLLVIVVGAWLGVMLSVEALRLLLSVRVSGRVLAGVFVAVLFFFAGMFFGGAL